MTIAGFAMLISGWLLVIATLILLPAGAARNGFIIAGLAVEVLGLGMVVRSHIGMKMDRA